MYNVDGGYLTYKLSFGDYDGWQYKHGSKVNIFATDNKPKRKEVYSEYKSQRSLDTSKTEHIKIVSELRKRIMAEQLMPICSIEGLEADDIVACWNIFHPEDCIVGVDKDFFQLPHVETTLYHNLSCYHMIDTIGKLPQYVQKLACHNFALYQILLGDVADNIPRLLAKGKEGKEQIEDVLVTNDLESYLLKTFGQDKVIRNAKLVLFPYYEWFYSPTFSFENDWFNSWCNGQYYRKANWKDLYQKINDCKLPNKVDSENSIYDLFSM